MRPGIPVRGLRSTTRAPAGRVAGPEPTLTMVSPWTTITASGVTCPVPSTSEPKRIAVTCAVRACSGVPQRAPRSRMDRFRRFIWLMLSHQRVFEYIQQVPDLLHVIRSELVLPPSHFADHRNLLPVDQRSNCNCTRGPERVPHVVGSRH